MNAASHSSTPAVPPRPWWRRLFAWDPPVLAGWEIFVMRGLFALVAWRATAIAVARADAFTGQPAPVGLARGLDLTFFSHPELTHAFMLGFHVCLVLYVAGLLLPLSLGWMLFVHVGAATLGNSQGETGHTLQGVALVMLAQWLSALWRVALQPNRIVEWARAGLGAGRHALDWASQALAAAYVVSGVSKLLGSDGLWIWRAPNFALQIRKANDMQYYSTLTHEPEKMQWLADLLVAHPAWSRLIVGVALPLELFAFLACFNRRLSLLFGLALIAFHSTVSEVMNLGFALNKALLLVLWINPLFWLWAGWKKATSRAS